MSPTPYLQNKTSIRGPLTMLAGVMLFSTNGFWQAVAPEGATPYIVGGCRLMIGAAALFVWCHIRYGGVSFRNWNWTNTVIYAVSLWLFQILFFKSVLIVGVAIGTVVSLGSSPIFTGLFELVIKGKKPDWAWYAATVLAIAGLVLINGVEGAGFAWYMLSLPLAAGVTCAACLVVAKGVMDNHTAEEGMFMVMLIGSVLMLPFFFFEPLEWIATGRGLLCVGMLGVVNAAVAFTLELEGLRTTPPLMGATLALGEPMGAAVIGILILDEPFSAKSLAGIACIFVSLLILIFVPVAAARRARRTGGA